MKANTNKDVIKTVLTDYSVEIAFSELRQSLFKNPLSGDAGLNENIGGYDGSPEVGGIKVDRYQNFWQGRTDVDEAQEHITFLIGFYADGFLTVDLLRWDQLTAVILIVYHRVTHRQLIWEF